MTLQCKALVLGNTGRILLIMLTLTAAFNYGCKISYSFTGASIPEGVNTFSVQYFQNRAPLVQPGLSQQLTDALTDKCKSQTNLDVISGTGDVNFEGEITDYNTRPLTVSADANAAVNRFSISVSVRFTNAVDPDLSFEQTFTRYEDYDSSLDLSQVESELSEKIIEMIVEDVFNKAFVNW